MGKKNATNFKCFSNVGTWQSTSKLNGQRLIERPGLAGFYKTGGPNL